MTTNQPHSTRDKIISAINEIPSQRKRQKTADEILDQYINTFVKLLDENQYARTHEDINLNLFKISLTSLRDKSGKYLIGKETNYWSYWFESNFPIYVIEKTGTNTPGQKSEMTTIKLTDLALELMFGSAINDEEISLHVTEKVINQHTPIEFYDRYYENLSLQYNKDDFVLNKIDIDSLNAYITQTLASKATAQNDPNKINFIKKLNNSLKYAYTIRALAIGCADWYHTNHGTPGMTYLLQASEKSEFGRTYLKGVNLQNCPKLVRHAALGHCHEHDIASSVFAWRNDTVRMIVKQYEINFVPSYTLDYLDNKNSFRKHIAKLAFPEAFETGNVERIEMSIKTAKQILTSVGFGATAKNSGWVDEYGTYKSSAIKTLVTNPENFENLINDNDFFKHFLDEQRLITDIIVTHYTNNGAFDNLSESLTKRLTTKSVKMAYLYQQYESKLIEDIKQEAIKCDNEVEILLTVHDAIYTTKPIDNAVTYEMQKSSPSFKLDHTVIRGNVNKTIESEHDREEREHHEFIANQERIARDRFPTLHKPAVKHEMESLFEDETEQVTSMEDAIEKEKKEAEAEMMKVVEQRKEEAKELTAVEQARNKWRPNAKAETSEEIESRRARLAKFMKQ